MRRFIDPDFDRLPEKVVRPREPRQETVTFKASREMRNKVEWLAETTGTSKGAAIKAAISAQYEQLTMMGGA